MPSIVAVNAGSSSLRLTVFGAVDGLRRHATATIERIGLEAHRSGHIPNFDEALDRGLEEMERQAQFQPLAIGHRVVHGGAAHSAPERVTEPLVADLRRMESIDPTHTPQALSLIEAVSRRYPALPQFACFDTAFHRTMPTVAQRYPLPRNTWNTGIRRYGFHGLSCESILQQLCATDPVAAQGRVLIAHLGNGASITAIRRGQSVDTSMGFSPTGGLMMGTRSGDLDPSVVTYLARITESGPDALDDLITHRSGLLGASGVSSDMREVLKRLDVLEAREAVDLYCYVARKHLVGLTAALGGVETVVFTGGIGEHAAAIRAGICTGLQYLGVELTPERNASNDAIISRSDGRVVVRVMKTDEDLVIAQHVRRLLE
jgi:acetate kinase